MKKLGFVCQRYDSRMDLLLRAGPSILICIENPGLIDSLKPLAPNTLYIYRDWSNEQPLDNPVQAAIDKVEALKPIIYKDGYRYDGFQLYNEVTQFDLNIISAFQRFQLECLDKLGDLSSKLGIDIKVGVDNDSTWHPALPTEWKLLWEIKSKVYEHPTAKWRCRHEYERDVYYSNKVDGWSRHKSEIAWLKVNNKKVLPHIIDEWGWDKGPPIGTWEIFKNLPNDEVKVQAFIQGLRDYELLIAPEVIGYCYFGVGIDHAWPAYGLLKPQAPKGIISAVVEFMKETQDTSWDKVDAKIRQWYSILKEESFRLWPYQLISYKGVKLHGDRIGAAIILKESEGNPTAKSYKPAVHFNGKDYYAWGLMQVIEKIPGHSWGYSRPLAEELVKPAVNVYWGMNIFYGMLKAANGDIWEALRRYSGFANYPMAEFWDKYGKKIQETYERWFGIRIPGPGVEEPLPPTPLPPTPSPPSPPPPVSPSLPLPEKDFKVIRRETGSTIIVGDTKEAGFPIKLYCWENVYEVQTGSKLEYGDGGFELPYFRKADTTFEIEYKGKRSKIVVMKEFPKTFVEYSKDEKEPLKPPEPSLPPKPEPMDKWPKPPDDNGIGIHFGDLSSQWVDKFLPLLHELHIKWVVLADGDPKRIGRVAERMLAEGIMPIARPQVNINGGADFIWAAKECKSPYVQIYNEPGDNREWKNGQTPNNWWEIFRIKWIGQAHKVRSVGYKPGLQLTSPNELWDMLEWMELSGEQDLWKDMWISLHLYPAHGCQPGCIEHGEWDILGFRLYSEICKQKMGFVPPMIVTEGGYTDGQGTPLDRAEWMVKIYEWFKYGTVPGYLFAFCPFILFSRPRVQWFGFSWADNIKHQPMVEAVKKMENFIRK